MTRVLLVSGQSLFGSGLKSLMKHESSIEIVGQEEDPRRALERAQELHPDVVIVDSNCPRGDAAELALAIFRAGARARIIELSLENNAIHIYRRESRIARQVEDLMSVIESDLSVSEVVSPAELSALAAARSRVYGFLGAVYNRMPDEKFTTNLASPAAAEFFHQLGGAEDAPPDMQKGLQLIQSFIRASQGRPVEELKTELAVERTRLMRGVKPGYGPRPPYEFVYTPTEQQLRVRSQLDIRAAYSAAGLAVPDDSRDQPDYIGFELDFMRHLTECEAQAWAHNEAKEVMRLNEQELAFLKQHVLVWVPAYCDEMLKDAQLDFYRGIALLTKGFLQGEAQRATELEHGVRMAQEV